MPIAFASLAAELLSLEPISEETIPESGIPSASPADSAISSTGEQWEPTGRCFYCHEPIKTDQRAPSDVTTRHIASKVRYLDCEPAQRMPSEIQRTADIAVMQKPDTKLFDKLDHYGIDIRDHRHWRFVKDVV